MKGMVGVSVGQNHTTRILEGVFRKAKVETGDKNDCVTDKAAAMAAYKDLIQEIAYLGEDDGAKYDNMGLLIQRAMTQLAMDESVGEIAQCLAQLDFVKVNEIAYEREENYRQTHYGKELKWTNGECSELLETYVLPALLERFALVADILYFKEGWNYWRRVGDITHVPKIAAMSALMVEPLGLVPSSRAIVSLGKSFETFLPRTVAKGDTTMQFNDCVINPNGELTQEPPTTFPRFIFDFNIYDTIVNGKPVPEVDDLLLHLANKDKKVAQHLVDRLSMTFVTSVSNKLKLGPKAVMLYGPSGENGKSTLAKLLIRALRNRNCCSFSFEDFKGYALSDLYDNILLVDMDASSVHVSPEVSTSLKRAITSDEMSVRRIYRSPETITPLCQFLVCTNVMPKAEDKTRGWDRRLEWFEVKDRLVRDKKWFDVIESREAADYFLAKLIKNAVRLIKEGKELKAPDIVLANNRGYASLNQNVRSWIDSEIEENGAKKPTDVLNRMPSALVYDNYETWCKENGETPLGITKFNQAVLGETGLIRKQIQIDCERDPKAFEWWQTQGDDPSKRIGATKAIVMCWIDPDNPNN